MELNLTDQELVILAILSETERYGYKIYGMIRDRRSAFGDKFPLSSIYAVLTRLQRRGLLTSREIPQSGKPPRKLYGISASGTAELESALSRAAKPKYGVLGKIEFILIVWPALSDEKRKGLLTDYYLYLKAKLEDLQSLASQEINPVSAAHFERQMYGVDAEIRWLNDFCARNGIDISDQATY